MTLDGISFQVSATAAAGIVSTDTCLVLVQQGTRIFGRYRGGSIQSGYLVGTIDGHEMHFRFSQRETEGGIHGGHSIGLLDFLSDGRLRIREHFTWKTREGAGVNIFEQVQA